MNRRDRTSPEQYFLITRQMRERALKTSSVQWLLDKMPNQIKKDLVQAFLKGEYKNKTQIVDYFISISDIAKAIVADRGGADIFDYLYHNKPILDLDKKPLDTYYLNNDSGKQIYMRLLTMQRYLPELLQKISKEFPDEIIYVDNVGSGQGLDMIGVLRDNPHLRDFVHVRNVDPNTHALEVGLNRITEYGLNSNFELVNSVTSKCKKREAHLLIGSGYFCPMSIALSKRVAKNDFDPLVRSGGYILYNATTLRMLYIGLFTDFTMRILGWHMGYKTEIEINSIAEYAGWSIEDVFFDADETGENVVGFNQMVVAKKY